jgi:hypothetical protein
MHIENTGNRVVKNQFIRFEFPAGSQILNFFLSQSPNELGVKLDDDGKLSANEKKYVVSHLRGGLKVGLRFIIAGVYGAPKINPFNQEGDVKFVSRAVTIGANHVSRTREFIVLWILFLLIPRAF